jgi:cyclophilin family peptidyl-prolyl cis-trans isomerase/HEAT repeat protein
MTRKLWRALRPFVGVALAGACAACTSGLGRAPSRITPAVRVDAAMLAMADARRADTRLLDSLLDSESLDAAARQRRTRAVLLVGQLRVRERYAVLRSLLAHADTALSATAAFALGLARDTASVQALRGASSGSHEGTAAEAAWALGVIGEPARSAVESALLAVRDGTLRAGYERRVSLLRAASMLRPVPTPQVIPFLLDPDARVASAAAYAISRSRAASGARALLAQALHADASVRAQVAVGTAPALVGDSLLDEALRVLPALMADPDLQVRVQAVRSAGALLARWDSSGASPTAATSLRDRARVALRDSMAPVRVTAAEGGASVLGTNAADWQAAFDADTTFMVQRALLDAATRRGLLLTATTAWRQHADPWRRLAAFEFASRSSTPVADLASSAWARADVSPRVRAAAASSLARVADQPDVRTVLDAMREDADPLVRASAIGALTGRAVASDAHWAAATYRADSSRDGHVVRAAALRVIASAWRRDSSAFRDETRALLAGLPVPADPLVRRGVRDVTPMAHWAAVEGPVVAASEYERVAAAWLTGTRRVTARLHTERGVITLALLPTDAPFTVDNFVQLARQQYFNGTRFHRVIAGFVAQDGDPSGTGSGGPGRSIRDELNRHRYERGAVGMALSGPDTGGSQYFLTLTPQPHLDGGYTVFARVTAGHAVMDALLLGDRILRVEVP